MSQRGCTTRVVTRVARQLGIGPDSLRNWVKQGEFNGGQRPGDTTEERRRIADLERENPGAGPADPRDHGDGR